MPGDPSDSRRQPYCLRAYREQPGSGIYLPGVTTYVYTSGKHPARQSRVRSIMSAFGFRRWTFFEGRKTQHYWTTIPGDHARMLRENEPPLLILEDDIEPREFRAWLQPPAGAQIAMLGGGRGGDRRGVRAARDAGIPVRRAYRYGYVPIDRAWMRVFGMWFSHAYLYLDRSAMLELADLLTERVIPVDTVQACNQWRWQVACLRVPMFWQNDGHHFTDTYDYDYEAQPAIRNPSALRAARQRALARRYAATC